ncbi:hypothetical protein CULT_2120002 [[Clostridium] ultunense Esp]|nr:hypothetical protein CULT_2120002 [[Clostridium] ultunense Esp]
MQNDKETVALFYQQYTFLAVMWQ